MDEILDGESSLDGKKNNNKKEWAKNIITKFLKEGVNQVAVVETHQLPLKNWRRITENFETSLRRKGFLKKYLRKNRDQLTS